MDQVEIVIGNVWSQISGIPYEVKEDLYQELSFDVPGAEWSPKFQGNIEDPYEKSKAWDGKIHLFKKSNNNFLTGLTYRVYNFFYKKYEIKPNIIWGVEPPERNLDLKWNSEKYKIREDYQTEIIENCIKKKRAVIEAATGSGKCINQNSICFTEEGMLPISYFAKKEISEGETSDTKVKVRTDDGYDDAISIYRDGYKESIIITTSLGYEITGTPEHQIKILKENNKKEWTKLKDIKYEDVIPIIRNNNIFGESDKLTESDAYFIGLYCREKELSINDIEKSNDEDIEKYIFMKKKKPNIEKYFKEELLIENENPLKKTVPISILKSPKNIVSSFIKGFLKTNGFSKTKKQIKIKSPSKKIIRTIQIALHVYLYTYGFYCNELQILQHL